MVNTDHRGRKNTNVLIVDDIIIDGVIVMALG
jgi:hypothetical protein